MSTICNLSWVEMPPEPTTEFDVLNTYEQMFTHVNFAFGSGTDGQHITTIPAKKGGKPLIYSGVNNPLIGGAPILTIFKDDPTEASIDVPNIPSLMYRSAEFDPSLANPREVAFVMRFLAGQDYEQFQDTFVGGDPFGDSGAQFRVIDGVNQKAGFRARVGNNDVIGSSFCPYWKKSLVQLSMTDSLTRMWVNGVYQGSIEPSDALLKTCNEIFVNTNNPDQQWFASYHKVDGLFSDDDRLKIGVSLMRKHKCGVDPQFPYAINVAQGLSSGVWSSTYTTRNPSGGGINPALTQNQWIINIRNTGAFEYQKVIATTPTVTESAVNAAVAAYKAEIGGSFESSHIYNQVKAFDNSGFGWKYMRGDYSLIA